MEERSLVEVVHLAKEKDEEAIEELLRRFDPLIAAMTHRYFFHEMDKEDFAQEARIMMLRAIERYNEEHSVSFAGYFQRSLRNLAIECVRHEHRQRVIPYQLFVKGEKAEQALLSATCDSFEQQVFLKEETGEYLSQLSRFEKKVFMAMLEGETFEEMATHFQKSVTSIKGAHKRCKKKFKDSIGEG